MDFDGKIGGDGLARMYFGERKMDGNNNTEARTANDAETKKRFLTPPVKPDLSTVKFVACFSFLGLAGFVLSVVGAVCYGRAIGVIPVFDVLSDMGLYSGLLLSLFVLFVGVCRFVRMVVIRNFKGFWDCFLGGVFAFVTLAIVMPAMGRLSPKYLREECAEHMEKIGETLKAYSSSHGGVLPMGDWCDVLMLERVEPDDLCCRGGFPIFVRGESSFALNVHAAGLSFLELPSDTVLLFETDYAGEKPEEMIAAGTREPAAPYFRAGAREIRKGAWNQIGDLDIVSCSHHAGLGCNILFADGRVEFVRKKDIAGLRWQP